jgi:hypothetical protein
MMPIGKLILPVAMGIVFVLEVFPVALGMTIRWVERVGAGLSLVGAVACRGMTMGWVVAAPVARPVAGIKPES